MDILADAGLSGVKPPCTLTINSDKGVILADLERYIRLVERLLYLSFTRPNISYVVLQLSQYFVRIDEDKEI